MENTKRIKETLGRTITARELIEALKNVDPNSRVAFASDYGDYCHTRQLHLISGDIEEEKVYESAYSRSGLATTDEEELHKEWENLPSVLVIK